MALDIEAAFDKVKALIESIDGMQTVKEGVPDSFGASITAFIAMAPITPADVATGLNTLEITFYILMGYKVGTSADAERKLMRGVQDLIGKFYVARTTDFDGVVSNSRINLSLAAQPEYEIFSGQEYRRYPVEIVVSQELTT